MSGYASFANFSRKIPTVEIPCVEATPKNLKDLGEMVPLSNFENCDVSFAEMKDAITGRKMVIPRDIAEGKFEVWQKEGFSYAENNAINSGRYTVAKLDEENPYKFYFRELNYHPEGTQIVVPEEKSPFILILGSSVIHKKGTRTVCRTPQNLKAFIFDGSHGFRIFPGVWHQPPVLHYYGKLTFRNKQPASHICVVYDSVKEDNHWMSFEFV